MSSPIAPFPSSRVILSDSSSSSVEVDSDGNILYSEDEESDLEIIQNTDNSIERTTQSLLRGAFIFYFLFLFYFYFIIFIDFI